VKPGQDIICQSRSLTPTHTQPWVNKLILSRAFEWPWKSFVTFQFDFGTMFNWLINYLNLTSCWNLERISTTLSVSFFYWSICLCLSVTHTHAGACTHALTHTYIHTNNYWCSRNPFSFQLKSLPFMNVVILILKSPRISFCHYKHGKHIVLTFMVI
jgi:hypothetical protein